MTKETILKRPDGTKIKISVRVSLQSDIYRYIDVRKCAPGKRTFIDVHDSDDYRFRRLDMEERRKHILSRQLEFVTEEEINQVCREIVEELYKEIAI